MRPVNATAASSRPNRSSASDTSSEVASGRAEVPPVLGDGHRRAGRLQGRDETALGVAEHEVVAGRQQAGE